VLIGSGCVGFHPDDRLISDCIDIATDEPGVALDCQVVSSALIVVVFLLVWVVATVILDARRRRRRPTLEERLTPFQRSGIVDGPREWLSRH
jgi:hypothetical protein